MTYHPYPTDLTDKEWEVIEPLLPKAKRGAGKKPKYSRRRMFDAIFYILKTGCTWRDLPHDFPPWKAVDSQYRRWKDKKVFESVHHHLRRSLRQLLGKNQEASVAIADSQSVKTTEKKGSVGLMGARRLRAGKDIYWLITLD